MTYWPRIWRDWKNHGHSESGHLMPWLSFAPEACRIQTLSGKSGLEWISMDQERIEWGTLERHVTTLLDSVIGGELRDYQLVIKELVIGWWWWGGGPEVEFWPCPTLVPFVFLFCQNLQSVLSLNGKKYRGNLETLSGFPAPSLSLF